jgi:phospholipase/lecithinase/hemolysin
MRSHRQLFSPVFVILLSLFWLATPAASHAKKKPFDRIVVFGTSLSDSGNAFVLIKDPTYYNFGGCDFATPLNVPPYDTLDELLIPDGVYARGGHHVSNGATWIEQYARSQGLAGTTRPALRSSGTKASNYAVGGARAREFDCRFNLLDQLAVYQEDFKKTSSKTLVVIEMGSNDVRDALMGMASIPYVSPVDPVSPDDPAYNDYLNYLEYLQKIQAVQESTLHPALSNIIETIYQLHLDGARHFLIVNVPAIGLTPAVKTFGDAVAEQANLLAKGFNIELSKEINVLNQLFGEDIITVLDLYRLLTDISNNADDYGITNTDTPCITPNIPPYTCARPDTYLFWDGIHPTKAVHAIVAQEAYELLRK